MIADGLMPLVTAEVTSFAALSTFWRVGASGLLFEHPKTSKESIIADRNMLHTTARGLSCQPMEKGFDLRVRFMHVLLDGPRYIRILPPY